MIVCDLSDDVRCRVFFFRVSFLFFSRRSDDNLSATTVARFVNLNEIATRAQLVLISLVSSYYY